MSFTFDGFEPANTTPVPDVLFDELLSELSEAELKVLLYIIRRTSGFKKQTDAISLTQFQKGIRKRATGEILDRGCGVKDRTTIIKALATLEEMGCIESTKGNDPQGDKAVSSYRIRFQGVVGKPDHPIEGGSGQTRPPWWAKPTTVVGKPDHGVVGKPDLQETVIQLNSEQETERQDNISPERESTATPGAFAPTPSDVSLSSADNSYSLEEMSKTYERALEFLKPHGELEAVKASHTPAQVIQLAQKLYDEGFRADGTFIDTPTAEEPQEEQIPEPSARKNHHPEPEPPANENRSHPEPPQQQTLMAPTSQQQRAKVETPTQGSRGRRQKGVPQLTLAGQHIIDLFDASKPIKRKTRLNADNINCANSLGLAVESDDDFNRAVQRMRDDPFLKEKKVAIDLDFIDRKFEKFLTIVDQEQEAATQAEKAKREAETRTKQLPPPPGLTPLTEQMRAMRARYGPKPSQPQGGN